MRYFIKLAYNGTSYYGWQSQPRHITIQKMLETSFHLLLKEKIELTGCGRTDAGVHAKQYFAHFDNDALFSDHFLEKLKDKLNSFLPGVLVIYSIFKVDNDLHARFSAIERTYKYYVTTVKNPFQIEFSHRVYEKLDVDAMNAAASLLIGNKDFTSFSKLHTDVNNNFCEVKTAYWEMQNDLLVFTITANRFL
jgi:tRNA pseudouridine38-40 synthase